MPVSPDFPEGAPQLYPARYWKPLKLFRKVFGNFNFLHRKRIEIGHLVPQGAGRPASGSVPHQVHGQGIRPLAREAHLCPQQHVLGAASENSHMSDLQQNGKHAITTAVVNGIASPLTLLSFFIRRDFP